MNYLQKLVEKRNCPGYGERILNILKESWSLGRTFDEFGGDKDQDMIRLEELAGKLKTL